MHRLVGVHVYLVWFTRVFQQIRWGFDVRTYLKCYWTEISYHFIVRNDLLLLYSSNLVSVCNDTCWRIITSSLQDWDTIAFNYLFSVVIFSAHCRHRWSYIVLFSRTQKVNDPCGQHIYIQEQCSTFDIDKDK